MSCENGPVYRCLAPSVHLQVIVTLDTGSGKTLIAGEVVRLMLGDLHAAQQVAVFLTPTNPLTEQVGQRHR